jgi:release factor glutamine methyltransferase
MAEKKLTTLLEIIKYSSQLLAEINIKDSRLNIELMFCDILNCDRIKLYLDFDKPLSEDEKSKFKIMLRRRMKHEPLQYILGKTNFYGYRINIDKRALIPRQETEILVEKVLDDIIKSKSNNISILEIGTGSGCIAIAISKELDKLNIKHKILSIDKFVDTIELAKSNAKNNCVLDDYIEFEVEDFLSKKGRILDFDYIVSNPPYIPENNLEYLDLEIKNYEPIVALTDGKDGLLFYEKFFNLYNERLKDMKLFVEIGDKQKKQIEDLLVSKSIKNYEFFRDYNNLDRILKIG